MNMKMVRYRPDTTRLRLGHPYNWLAPALIGIADAICCLTNAPAGRRKHIIHIEKNRPTVCRIYSYNRMNTVQDGFHNTAAEDVK